jgi:lipopolysaccharide biosynthesis glycosyltransferase
MIYSVAMFSDTSMLPGLHVTLLTLLRSLDALHSHNVTISVFLDSVPPREKELLRATHRLCDRGSQLELIDFSPSSPTDGDLLHGNATAYGRLSLARLLPNVRRCLYLDCDLVVNRCIVDVFGYFDGRSVLVADGVHPRGSSLDRELFAAVGLDMAGRCFNSGVMGIDLGLWREQEGDRIVAETAKRFRGMFRSADQALLNVAFCSNFVSAGNAINEHLYPSSPPMDLDATCIYHLVGSPKPWDMLGSLASNHYLMWRSLYDETAIRHRWPPSYASFRRSARLARQTFSSIWRRHVVSTTR